MISLQFLVQTQSDHVKLVDQSLLSCFSHKNVIWHNFLNWCEPQVCHLMPRTLETCPHWFYCSLVIVLYHSVSMFTKSLFPCLSSFTQVLYLCWTGGRSLVAGDHVEQVGALTGQLPNVFQFKCCTFIDKYRQHSISVNLQNQNTKLCDV